MTSPISGYTAAGYRTDATTSGTSTTTGTTSTSSSSSSSTGLDSLLDPEAFLKLLVAQLQYQDPTNPTDTSSFMNQTAMLSQVQTMSSMSSSLTSLIASQQAQSATAMIGKQITWTTTSGGSASGVVTAAALSSSGANLKVGDATVPLANVTSVTQASS